jgi:hypothetical protein
MVQGFEKRTCHRFEIPGAQVSFRKKKLFGFTEYSTPRLLINISKGGASFDCGEILKPSQRLIVRLHLPNEKSLELFADVRWQRETAGFTNAVGIIFAPFGQRFNYNPPASLDVLRKLDQKYVANRQ